MVEADGGVIGLEVDDEALPSDCWGVGRAEWGEYSSDWLDWICW